MQTSNGFREKLQIRGSWKNPILYKTTLCDYWVSSAECKFGQRCWYAHGPDEMRFVPRLDQLPDLEAIKHALFVDPTSAQYIPEFLDFCNAVESDKGKPILDALLAGITNIGGSVEKSEETLPVPKLSTLDWSPMSVRPFGMDSFGNGNGMEKITKEFREETYKKYGIGPYARSSSKWGHSYSGSRQTPSPAADLNASSASFPSSTSPSSSSSSTSSTSYTIYEKPDRVVPPQGSKNFASRPKVPDAFKTDVWSGGPKFLPPGKNNQKHLNKSWNQSPPHFFAPPPPGFPAKPPNCGYAGYRDVQLMRRIEEECGVAGRKETQFSRPPPKPYRQSRFDHSTLGKMDEMQGMDRSFDQMSISRPSMNRSFF